MKILLIGNYFPDRQESMARYAAMLYKGLTGAGFDVTLALPGTALNRGRHAPAGWWKWIGYVDKLILAPRLLDQASRQADIVHVCDHSNALYVRPDAGAPHVVTCHDLLAVRGALGEQTDCPASFSGRWLQRAIISGLNRADAVACVSQATLNDARRLLDGYRGELLVAPNAMNYPYRPVEPVLRERRLREVDGFSGNLPYVLHVGSNLRRKNREGVLRAFARAARSWDGKLVFAGQGMDAPLQRLAVELGVAGRVVDVVKPDNALLEILYGGAHALLFPSRFEGFGWPVIEAQACGCPVICSNREPMPEVSGRAAILLDPEDSDAFADAILDLAVMPEKREVLVQHGLKNAAGFGNAEMIARFSALYQRVLERS